MIMNFNEIEDRYLHTYINDDQLIRFKNLGVITDEQYNELYAKKYPTEQNEPLIQ